MESPKDALTNLYKIVWIIPEHYHAELKFKQEGVSTVKWTTYVASSDEHVAFRDHERDFSSLLAAEFDLRSNGYIVLADAVEEQLWLFETSTLASRHEAGELGGVARVVRITERYRLQKKSSGLLNAQDFLHVSNAIDHDEQLRKRKRSMEEAYPHLKASNFRAVMLNSLIESQRSNANERAGPFPLKGDEDSRYIYSNFVAALIITLSYLLTASRKFVPMGPGVLLRGDFVEFDISAAFNAAEATSSTSTVFLLTSSLQANGDLFIMFYPCMRSRIWPSRRLPQNSDVLLAPFGWKGMLQPSSPYSLSSELGEQDSMAKHLREWRKECLILLRQRGISYLKESDWVAVDLDHQPRIPFATPIHIEWPSRLCCQLPKQQEHRRSGRSYNFGDLSKLTDPLSAAEEWFLNSAVREKLVQQQIRAYDQKPTEIPEDASEEEDIPPGIQTNIGEFNEIHNAAGIYPTPPDGSKSHVVSTTIHRTKAVSKLNDGQQVADEDVMEGFQESEAEFDPPSTAEMGLGSYDHLEDDDLFGDVQNQMYTNHGLTEDDFSFFDKPDDDSFSARRRDNLPSVPTRILESDSHAEGDGDGLFVASPETADTDIHLKQESSARYKPEIPEVQDAREVLVRTIPSRGSVEYQTTKSTTLQPSRKEETVGGKHVPGKNPVVLDDKYIISGKFAPLPVEHPSSSRPDKAPEMTNGIPNIIEPNQTNSQNSLASKSSSTNFAEDQEALRKIPTNDHSLASEDNVSFVKKAQRSLEMRQTSMTSRTSFPVKSLFELENFHIESTCRLGPVPARNNASKEEQRSMEFIQLAQIVADQFVHYDSLSHNQGEQGPIEDEGMTVVENALGYAINSLFSKSHRCTLAEIASLGATSQDPQSTESSSIQAPSWKSESNKARQFPVEKLSASIKLLQPPDVLVKRGEILMDMSSTALQFWKELGLRPVHGPKNITAFCFCPEIPMLLRGAKMLLEAVGQTYMSLRLGTHSVGHSLLENHASGLVAFPADKNASITLEAMDLVCEEFGKALSTLAGSERTILIYMISSSEEEQSIWKLCELFRHIFKAYATNVRMTDNPSDLVLQIIPFDWVGSESRIAIPSLGSCTQLSKIIYDKCPLPSRAKSPFSSGSALQISQQLPRSINFKVTSSSSYNPLNHAPVVHLGYVWDEDSHWLSVALINEIGDQQWTASYYIGQVSNPWPCFVAVTNEIWEILGEAIDFTQDECKVYIAKLEPITKAEMQAWTKLGADAKVKIYFASVDENPPVRLFDKALEASMHGFDHETMTPLGSSEAASPDTTILKSLGEDDPNARLVNADERRWSIVSSCGLSATGKFLEIDNEVNCGYIVGKGKVMFCLCLMQDSNASNIEELLGKYHALSFLSRARYLNDELPWHLAVAKKAHAGLEAAMSEDDI